MRRGRDRRGPPGIRRAGSTPRRATARTPLTMPCTLRGCRRGASCGRWTPGTSSCSGRSGAGTRPRNRRPRPIAQEQAAPPGRMTIRQPQTPCPRRSCGGRRGPHPATAWWGRCPLPRRRPPGRSCREIRGSPSVPFPRREPRPWRTSRDPRRRRGRRCASWIRVRGRWTTRVRCGRPGGRAAAHPRRTVRRSVRDSWYHRSASSSP